MGTLRADLVEKCKTDERSHERSSRVMMYLSRCGANVTEAGISFCTYFLRYFSRYGAPPHRFGRIWKNSEAQLQNARATCRFFAKILYSISSIYSADATLRAFGHVHACCRKLALAKKLGSKCWTPWGRCDASSKVFIQARTRDERDV